MAVIAAGMETASLPHVCDRRTWQGYFASAGLAELDCRGRPAGTRRANRSIPARSSRNSTGGPATISRAASRRQSRGTSAIRSGAETPALSITRSAPGRLSLMLLRPGANETRTRRPCRRARQRPRSNRRRLFKQAGPALRLMPIATCDHPTPAGRRSSPTLGCTRFGGVFGVKRPDWRVSLSRIFAYLAEAMP
jgi:hypothetical protein